MAKLPFQFVLQLECSIVLVVILRTAFQHVPLILFLQHGHAFNVGSVDDVVFDILSNIIEESFVGSDLFNGFSVFTGFFLCLSSSRV